MINLRKKISILLSVILLVMSMPLNVLANEKIYYKNTSNDITNTLVPIGDLVNNPISYLNDDIEVTFNITTYWWNTIQGEITLKNVSGEKIENWSVGFDFPHEITSIWDSQIEKYENNKYIIKNASWNQDIQKDGVVKFGFNAKFDNKNVTIPTDFKFLIKSNKLIENGYEINYKTTSDWGSGFNGEISIKNTSDEIIEDWSLTFNFDRKINNMWNAKIISDEDNTYNIKNAGWNANIAPNQTVSIGFGGEFW